MTVCNVCGEVRPDAIVSVAKRPGPILTGDVRPVWNIKYCNDRPACTGYAQRSTEWTGPAGLWKVTVPCVGVDIEDLGSIGLIAGRIPYHQQWTSISGATTAILFLAADSPDAASRYATDALRVAGVEISTVGGITTELA